MILNPCWIQREVEPGGESGRHDKKVRSAMNKTRKIVIALSTALFAMAISSCSDRQAQQHATSVDQNVRNSTVAYTKESVMRGLMVRTFKNRLLEEYDDFQFVPGTNYAIISKNGKYGLLDFNKNKLLLDFQYDEAGDALLDKFVFGKGGKYGVVDKDGKEIVPFEFEGVRIPDENIYFVKKDGKWGIWDTTDDSRRIDPQFDEVRLLFPGLYAVKKDGKWAFMRDWDVSKLNFAFDSIDDLNYELYAKDTEVKKEFSKSDVRIPVLKNGLVGFVDENGVEVIPPKYTFTTGFESNGLAWVETEKRPAKLDAREPNVGGWIDRSGKEIVPLGKGFHFNSFWDVFYGKTKDGKTEIYKQDGSQIDVSGYEDIGFYGDGMIPVKKDGRWGYIDTNGEMKITPAYTEISSFCQGLALVSDNCLWGIIDKKGGFVIAPQYEMIRDLNPLSKNSKDDIIVGVKKDGKWGVVDLSNNVKIEPKYDEITFINPDTAVVKLDGKYSIVDSNGKEKLAGDYVDIYPAPDRSFIFAKKADGSFDLVSYDTFKKVNKDSFEEYRPIHDKFVWAKKDGKWGVIDAEGNTVVAPKYTDLRFNDQGLSPALWDGKWGLVNYKGEEVLPNKYEDMMTNNRLGYPAKLNGKWGLVNKGGQEISEFKYDEVEPLNQNYLLVKEKGKWGVINSYGSIILPSDYDLKTEKGVRRLVNKSHDINVEDWLKSN